MIVVKNHKIIPLVRHWPLSPYLFNILSDEMESRYRTFVLQSKVLCYGGCLEEKGVWLSVLNRACTVLRMLRFYIEKWQAVAIQNWVFSRNYLSFEQSEPVSLGNNPDGKFCQIINELSSENENFINLYKLPKCLRTSLKRSLVKLISVLFKILNQHFLNEKFIS